MSTEHTSNKPTAIKTATVIGAGTMGAAIAAHLANAGLTVYLLDMADHSATNRETERDSGSRPDPASARTPRNRIVAAGFERMRAARPANLFTPQIADRITLGNLDDDLADFVGRSDWIIEAIVEELAPKQALMARIEQVAPAHAIISTNTSGLPIREIAQGRSAAFQRHFLGTHFFNPPRYLYLMELIPTAQTDPATLEHMRTFATHSLGKGVVLCKDTPNFIANRMISFIISHLMEFAVSHGYTVEEVDYLAGPLIGRPRSGVFRLLDVIGIDVMALINRNLYALIPHDPDRDALRAPKHSAVWQTLIDDGHLGVKRGQGFYQTVTDDAGNRAFWSLDLAAAAHGEVRYLPPQTPNFPTAAALRRAPLEERLRNLVADTDRAGVLVWRTLSHALVYAARRIPEISDSLVDIDRVMRWGFLWELGPFEIWDALGVAETAARMTADGLEPPVWVTRMLTLGHTSFYTTEGAQTLAYDPAAERHAPLPGQAPPWDMPTVHRMSQIRFTNQSATLHLLPPDNTAEQSLLLLEFHSKLNALDAGSLDALEAARDALYTEAAAGLLIANRGIHFCVGANLQAMLDAAQAQQWDELDTFIRRGQYLFLDLRRAPKPVVAAPFQRVLGGGVEVCLAARRVVAQAETYMGLVEVSVGLIPGWGGCKELARRHITPSTTGNGLATGLAHVFETIVLAKVSTSAHDAQVLGFLTADDDIEMNPERLLETARERTLALAHAAATEKAATSPSSQAYAAGRNGLDALHAWIDARHAQDKFSDHDRLIARRLAQVLCGDGPEAAWQSEEGFLERERTAFLSLAGEAKTQERMAHMLRAGKPLKN